MASTLQNSVAAKFNLKDKDDLTVARVCMTLKERWALLCDQHNELLTYVDEIHICTKDVRQVKVLPEYIVNRFLNDNSEYVKKSIVESTAQFVNSIDTSDLNKKMDVYVEPKIDIDWWL
jgi:hypothetical protein